MRRYTGIVLVLLLLAGCGSTSPKKQAEDLGSIAAEGALVAHDASEGSTTHVFTRVHSRALREKANSIDRQAADPRLERLAGRIADALERLADDPDDRGGAARIQRQLEQAADDAGKLEQSA
jgi:carboxypeptidase C (cathepsin A)